jgi:hypothetical protein
MIIDLKSSIVSLVHEILHIARYTLQEHGTHLPTAILHTMDRMIPIVLPFKDDEQKSALTEHVKKQVAMNHAHAVTTITTARIVDSRTGKQQQCLVIATSIQGGRPYVVLQYFSKNEETGIIDFGLLVEGEDAEIPGQMIIIPEWEEGICH